MWSVRVFFWFGSKEQFDHQELYRMASNLKMKSIFILFPFLSFFFFLILRTHLQGTGKQNFRQQLSGSM